MSATSTPTAVFGDESLSGSSTSDTEDDEGIFFGAHQPKESLLVSHLSKVTPDSPVPSPVASSSKPRLRKRDSREFLRRRTMLHTSNVNTLDSKLDSAGRTKRYPGGFYEKGTPRPRSTQLDSDSELSSPTRTPRRSLRSDSSPDCGPSHHCDVTLDFANFRLSDILSSPAPSASPGRKRLFRPTDSTLSSAIHRHDQSDQDDGDAPADSDKENTAPLPSEQRLGHAAESSVNDIPQGATTGTEWCIYDEQQVSVMDTGGLKLSDFADPDTVDDQAAGDDSYSYRTSSDDESAHSFSDDETGTSPETETAALSGPTGDLSDVGDEDFLPTTPDECEQSILPISFEATDLEIVGADGHDETINPENSNATEDALPPATSFLAHVQEDLQSVPLPSRPGSPASEGECLSQSNQGEDSHASVDSLSPSIAGNADDSGDQTSQNSPLPSARGGFVVIPSSPHHLHGPIRAEMGSPWRALPSVPPPDLEQQSSVHPLIGLAPLSTSPSKIDRDSTSLGTSQKTAGIPLWSATTSSSLKQTLKSPAVSSNWTTKSAARQTAIRSQLDTAFTNRLGPPQRVTAGGISGGTHLAKSTIGHRQMKSSTAQSAQQTTSRLTSSSSSSGSRSSAPSVANRTLHSHAAPLSAGTVSESKGKAQGIIIPRTLFNGARAIGMPLPDSHQLGQSNRPTGPTSASRPPSFVSRALTANATPAQPRLGSIQAAKTHQIAGSVRDTLNPRNPNGGQLTRRPGLGQPSRLVRVDQANGRRPAINEPVSALHESSVRSPLRPLTNQPRGTPLAIRKTSSPSRLGTPSRLHTPTRMSKKLATPAHPPSSQRAIMAQSGSPTGVSQPCETATMGCQVNQSHTEMEPSRADQDLTEERMSPPISSAEVVTDPPTSTGTGNLTATRISRPRRVTKEQEPKPTPKDRPRTVPGSAMYGMSQKELSVTTQRNTTKNEVYHCAIERRVVRKDGPRPPSPTSKIRTTAEREEADKKAGRIDRANRRSKGSECQEDEIIPAIERIKYSRGAGDDEDWSTPARLVKKGKPGQEKRVNWDRELVIIRDDGRQEALAGSAHKTGCAKSSLKVDSRVALDKYGNLVELGRPKENLKRTRIVVNAIVYDGEDAPGDEPRDEVAVEKAVKRKSK